MSAIRAYLEEKAALPPGEWLRREPRETLPEIADAVRAAVSSLAAGRRPNATVYDDEVEVYVERAAGDLPEHRYHGHPDRHPLTVQLGHECYLARCALRDEENGAALAAALADGWAQLDYAVVEDGKRYQVRRGTLYSGYRVPVYGSPGDVTARALDGSFVFVPKRARNGFRLPTPALIRAGWST